MKYGISGADVPAGFPFATNVNQVGAHAGVSPCLLGAFAYVETLSVEFPEIARTFLSYDNGHGLCQLTSSWPDLWRDPATNLFWACDKYLVPSIESWHSEYGYEGDTLVRCVAAEYNAGPRQALRGHFKGNVGMYTSTADGLTYDVRVLAAYKTLAAGALPPLPSA